MMPPGTMKLSRRCWFRWTIAMFSTAHRRVSGPVEFIYRVCSYVAVIRLIFRIPARVGTRAAGTGGVASYGTTTRLTNVPQFASKVLGPPGIYSTPSQMDPSESATAAE
jgi:hypothetical protein